MRNPSFHRAQGGFSIVELMIGIALGLVVLATLTWFFVTTSSNRYEIERTSRQIENGRYATDTLRSAVQLAGFYAELSQSAATYTAVDPCTAPQNTAAIAAGLGLSVSPLQVPLPVYGYAADAPAFPTCVTDRLPNTDVLVLRRFGTDLVSVVNAAAQSPNQVFVEMSRCATDSTTTPWTVDFGVNTAAFTLHNKACTASTDLYPFHVEIYYVRTFSDTAGDGIPTLVKLDLDNKAIRISPLVEGVRSLRLAYGVDNNNDGSPDEYRRCDTVTTCTVAQWSNVTTVRVSILAENLEDSQNYTDTKTYNLDGYQPPAFNDHRKRAVFGATVSLPNRSGPRES